MKRIKFNMTPEEKRAEVARLTGEVEMQYQQLKKTVPTATQFERDGVIAYTDQKVNAANENVAADMVFEF